MKCGSELRGLIPNLLSGCISTNQESIIIHSSECLTIDASKVNFSLVPLALIYLVGVSKSISLKSLFHKSSL